MHRQLLPSRTDADPPAPLKFDRRRSERRAAQGVLAAHATGGPRFGRAIELTLLDESAGGLRATSNEPESKKRCGIWSNWSRSPS